MHGVTGLTLNPADPDGLATAISLLLDDGNLRAVPTSGAAPRYRQFSLEDMTKRTFSALSGNHGIADWRTARPVFAGWYNLASKN